MQCNTFDLLCVDRKRSVECSGLYRFLWHYSKKKWCKIRVSFESTIENSFDCQKKKTIQKKQASMSAKRLIDPLALQFSKNRHWWSNMRYTLMSVYLETLSEKTKGWDRAKNMPNVFTLLFVLLLRLLLYYCLFNAHTLCELMIIMMQSDCIDAFCLLLFCCCYSSCHFQCI